MNTINNTKVFGIIILLSGLITLTIGSFETTMDFSIMNLLPVLSGIVITYCGHMIYNKYSNNKVCSAGIYAMSIGLSNVITAIGLLIASNGLLFILSIFYFILGFSFIAIGISFMGGTSKKIYRMIFSNILLILLSAFMVYGSTQTGDIFTMIQESMDILVSILFIAILLSSDVRHSTKRAKMKQRNYLPYGSCDYRSPNGGRRY